MPPHAVPPTGWQACPRAASRARVAVSNTGTAAFNGWTLTLTVPSGVTVTQAWGSFFTQSGSTVVIHNMPYNANLAPKAATNIGFLANTTTGPPSAPDSVHATCTSP